MNEFSSQQTRMMGLSGDGRISTIYLIVLIQYRIVTDRRTDIFAAAYHIASRGQKCHCFACAVLLKEGCLNSESKMQDEAETETIPEETDTLTLQMASARPRRLAELNIATRVKPIPNYSSMFILSPSNRYTTFFIHHLVIHSIIDCHLYFHFDAILYIIKKRKQKFQFLDKYQHTSRIYYVQLFALYDNNYLFS